MTDRSLRDGPTGGPTSPQRQPEFDGFTRLKLESLVQEEDQSWDVLKGRFL